MSASLQACKATNSTPRQEASSNAIAVANSDAGEPSMPTSTGNRENCSANGTSSWITGVVDQPGTDRSEQTTPQRTLAAAADHHH